MQKKNNKIIGIVLNVIIGIICLMVLLLAVSAINANSKGYSSLFGYSLYAVETDSMEGDEKGSFPAGSLVFAKELKGNDYKDLKEGDVITFFAFDTTTSQRFINTHRIIEVNETNDVFTTQGDNVAQPDARPVFAEDVIGVYRSHVGGVGKAILYIQSTTGFLIAVVFPSLLIVVYAIYNLIRTYSAFNKAKVQEEKEKMLAEYKEQERLRLEAQKQAEEEQKRIKEDNKLVVEDVKLQETTEKAEKETKAEDAKEDKKPVVKKVTTVKKTTTAKTAPKKTASAKTAKTKTTAQKAATPKKAD